MVPCEIICVDLLSSYPSGQQRSLKTRCVSDLAKVDETGTGRRGLVLCTHVLYPNANTCPCTHESLSTRVLVHAGPSQRSRWKKVQHSKRHTSSHLLNFQHPKATFHVLPPWTTTFSESSMQTGVSPNKNKSLKFGILL